MSAGCLDRPPMEGISGQLLVNSPGLALAPDSVYVKDPPHPSPLEQGALGLNRRSDNLDSSDEPQFGSDRRQSVSSPSELNSPAGLYLCHRQHLYD